MRTTHQEPACPGCRSSLALDDHRSTQAARLVYACRGCGRYWSVGSRDGQLIEEREEREERGERGIADRMSRTVRMPAIQSPAAPAAREAVSAQSLGLPDGLTVALEVTGGPERGQVFHLDRRIVVIGREEGEMQIPDSMISRRHASLE